MIGIISRYKMLGYLNVSMLVGHATPMWGETAQKGFEVSAQNPPPGTVCGRPLQTRARDYIAVAITAGAWACRVSKGWRGHGGDRNRTRSCLRTSQRGRRKSIVRPVEGVGSNPCPTKTEKITQEMPIAKTLTLAGGNQRHIWSGYDA
ncbi:unnamed protein product, partial [Discosporangium mesarthrocarpum]